MGNKGLQRLYITLCNNKVFREEQLFGASTMANTYLTLSNDPKTGNKPKIEPTKDVAQFNQIIIIEVNRKPVFVAQLWRWKTTRSMSFHLRS